MTKQHCTCTAGVNSIVSSEQVGIRHGNVSEQEGEKGSKKGISEGNKKASKKGIRIKAKWLQQAGFQPNSEYSVLILPGQILITNQPQKQQCIRGIEELQHREFELGVAFVEPIRQLALNAVAY